MTTEMQVVEPGVIKKNTQLYDQSFYDLQMDGSYRSAAKYVRHIIKIFKPDSVVDIGCGRGTWLKVFGENGVKKLTGLDGSWISQDKMLDKAIQFFPVDLDKPLLHQSDKYDLAISLEVGEHLKAASAKTFVESLTALSDVIMFSAAYTKQGGTDHINEQPHTYWARLFLESGYTPYDLFRPTFWGDSEIEFWYQQNTFLYVKNGSEMNQVLKSAGYLPIENIKFMDCVHPSLYGVWTDLRSVLKRMLVNAIPKPLIPLALRLKKVTG